LDNYNKLFISYFLLVFSFNISH